jgi:O-antigen/teichoic acid export membrane protein
MKFYSRGHARRSVFHTAVFRVLSQVATLAGYVVLVRALTEHAFGVLSLLYAFIPVVSTVASLGIEQTLRRYQPEYLRAGNASAAAWLLRVAASARFLVNLLLLGIILLTWQWLAPVFQLTPYYNEFVIFSVLVLLHFQASILQASLSAHMLQGYSVGMTVVLSVGKLVGYLVLRHFGLLTLDNAILVDLSAYALMYIGLRVAHAVHCRPPATQPAKAPDATERKRLLRYSLFNNFNDAGTLLLSSRSDNFFIGAMMNPVAVGAYAFYSRLTEMATQLLPTRQFGNVIQPLFFSVPRAQAADRLPKYFTLLLNLTGMLQLPITAFGVAYHAEIVQVVFGGKFANVSWVLPVILGFATLNRVDDAVLLVAQYQEKASIILLSKVFAIYNVVAMLLLVPALGVYGAAIASGSAQVMKNAFIWWKVRDAARWRNFRDFLVMTVVIWGGCIALCEGLKASLDVPAVAHLALGVVVCGLAALLFARSPALSSADREILGGIFQGREARILGWLGILRPKAAAVGSS